MLAQALQATPSRKLAPTHSRRAARQRTWRGADAPYFLASSLSDNQMGALSPFLREFKTSQSFATLRPWTFQASFEADLTVHPLFPPRIPDHHRLGYHIVV
jgi:hypothetical protein